MNKRRAVRGLPYIKPLYSVADANQVFPLFVEVPYGVTHAIDENISFHYSDTGHILGSAAVHLGIKENGKSTFISFSGDVGRYRDVILRSPESFRQADYLILESTYGNSLHQDFEGTEDALLMHIEETCLLNKGKLIIPAFSVGRTQEILYALNKLETQNRLPALPYYVDSPLSIKTTQIVKKHSELFNKHVVELMKHDQDPFDFKGLHMISDAADSKALNRRQEPMVIISASGMAEAGRVKHHIANAIEDVKNTILLVGFCEYHSLGARLQRGEPRVRIFGEEFDVKASVASIRSMSAHGDYDDLCQFLSCQNPMAVKKLFLVHGEYDVQQEFQHRLLKKQFKDVIIPDLHQKVKLD
ncbi:MAG TPA: MBL fold metallo-hydrolase [Chitinophagaceae bacterium]|nr:MBL fold metallo-hydrolase [Chitinophagaceae bacterium]